MRTQCAEAKKLNPSSQRFDKQRAFGHIVVGDWTIDKAVILAVEYE
jgi:hypothetical protein